MYLDSVALCGCCPGCAEVKGINLFNLSTSLLMSLQVKKILFLNNQVQIRTAQETVILLLM